MKRLYWRPTRVPWQIHVVIALVAISSMLLVQSLRVRLKQPHYRTKLKAARLMKQGMDAIRDHRRTYIGELDPVVDPIQSGMIGVLNSTISSNTGSLEAKQTTINPNWAAVMVEMLRKAGVKRGDVVALGVSGSFPAMNLAALSAAEAMGLRTITISSAASSTWGANIPRLTWLDMEAILIKHGIIKNHSVAASIGGQGDRGIGISKKGRELLERSILKRNIALIKVKEAKENLNKRMALYYEYAKDEPIAAYVNVGGGTISVGTSIGKRLFRPGLNKRAPPKALALDSVLSRFSREGVPVIHIRLISRLAQRYGLPLVPQNMAEIGQGKIYVRLEYNFYLVLACLILLLTILYLFIKRDYGYRIFIGSAMKTKSPNQPPRQMV